MGRPAGEPPEDRRCIAMKTLEDGTKERCKNFRLTGLTVCRYHGGSNPAAKRKSQKAKILSAMQRFVTPIDADDIEADPIYAFEMEFRRTLGRIRWYDEALAALEQEDLIWGQTKREEIGASEFTGHNETYEARVNMYHELQFAERKHLLDMEKIWIGAKLDEQRLVVQRGYVAALDKAIVGILSSLGHDVADPAVRAVVRDQLLALPVGSTTEGE
jgi:hypothetical protein